MGYTSGSYNKRRGIPVGLLALILGLVLFWGLAGPLPAFAANQSGCGWCHGTLTNSATALSNGKNQTTDLRDNINAPTVESSLMPQADNDRGLHGIHMNYSSATYLGNANQKIYRSRPTDPNRTRLSPYIDNGASGAISYANNTAVVYSRGDCGWCHASSHPNHEGGFLQWTTTVRVKGRNSSGGSPIGYMVYTSAGRGVSYKTNIVSTAVGPRGGSCTKACHKGTSASNPAPWGNYTSASVRLTCNACHADSSGVSGTEPALSGVHAGHITNGARVTLTNATTMNSANNGGCRNCHTDNTGEGRATKDWGPRYGSKAYPHASEGTNVVSDNVTLTGQITSPIKAGKATTCTAACHPRSSAINVVPFNRFMNWSSSMDCNMCHYYEAAPSYANNTAVSTGKLPGAHGLHFTGGVTCDKCHPVPTDTTHVKSLPVSVTGVQYVAGLGYTGGTSGTCQNSCHLSVSGAWSTTYATQGCATCHNYPGASNDWPSNNGHSIRLSNDNLQTYTHLSLAGSYNKTTDQYSNGNGTGVTQDANKCGLCHGGGTHMNGRVDKNPNSNTAYGYDGVSTFSIVSSATAPTMTCNNVVCHSGKTTPNWY